jgi:sec-independent protein translocase protein TatA
VRRGTRGYLSVVRSIFLNAVHCHAGVLPRSAFSEEVTMLGLGPVEMVLIFFVLLLLFGAKRLPELASGMGKGIRDFKRSLNGVDEPSIQANQHQSYLAQTPPAPAAVSAAPPSSLSEVPAAAPGEPKRLG